MWMRLWKVDVIMFFRLQILSENGSGPKSQEPSENEIPLRNSSPFLKRYRKLDRVIPKSQEPSENEIPLRNSSPFLNRYRKLDRVILWLGSLGLK
jgi:hypothetical protein